MLFTVDTCYGDLIKLDPLTRTQEGILSIRDWTDEDEEASAPTRKHLPSTFCGPQRLLRTSPRRKLREIRLELPAASPFITTMVVVTLWFSH